MVGVGATPIPVLKNNNLPSILLFMLSVREALSTIFEVFGMTRPELEPWSLVKQTLYH